VHCRRRPLDVRKLPQAQHGQNRANCGSDRDIVFTSTTFVCSLKSNSISTRRHATLRVRCERSLSLTLSCVYTRTPVARKHVFRTSNLYPDTYMSTDTCRRIQVARPGYMLTVSRRHNYYSFICHGRLVSLCIQQLFQSTTLPWTS